MRRIRLLALAVTAMLPGPFKRLVYRWVFGYRLGRKVRIGIAILDCQKLQVGDGASIGHGVAFLRCGAVTVGRNAVIGSLNLFRGGSQIELGDYSQVLRMNVINAIPDHDCTNDPVSSFHLGYGSVVTAEHRIDFTARVTIGRCSIFGGRNSSIWTHNRREGWPVEIGDHCYIGSEIRMAPGSKIPDCSIVGLGSVITRPLSEKYSLFAGVPAKKQRNLTNEDMVLIFGKTRQDLPDQPFASEDLKQPGECRDWTAASASNPGDLAIDFVANELSAELKRRI
jgi:acetyltransferase-like isoleucine patch superfamily enzyme